MPECEPRIRTLGRTQAKKALGASWPKSTHPNVTQPVQGPRGHGSPEAAPRPESCRKLGCLTATVGRAHRPFRPPWPLPASRSLSRLTPCGLWGSRGMLPHCTEARVPSHGSRAQGGTCPQMPACCRCPSGMGSRAPQEAGAASRAQQVDCRAPALSSCPEPGQRGSRAAVSHPRESHLCVQQGGGSGKRKECPAKVLWPPAKWIPRVFSRQIRNWSPVLIQPPGRGPLSPRAPREGPQTLPTQLLGRRNQVVLP